MCDNGRHYAVRPKGTDMPLIPKAAPKTPSRPAPVVAPSTNRRSSRARQIADLFRSGGAKSTALALQKAEPTGEGATSMLAVRSGRGDSRTALQQLRVIPRVATRIRGPLARAVTALGAADTRKGTRALAAMSDTAFERTVGLLDLSGGPRSAARNRVVLDSVVRQSDAFIDRAMKDNSEHIDVCVEAMTAVSREILAAGFLRRPAEEQAELREMQTEIRETYNGARDHREELARIKGGNRVVSLARPHTLKPGTLLYTSKTPERAANLLRNGIDVGQQANNFGDAELGAGLYFDTEGGTYRNAGKMVLVAEVVDDLEGVTNKPVEEYRRANRAGPRIDQKIREGWTDLQERHPFIRHDALPPGNTELCFRDTQRKIRIIGVVENPGWEVTAPRPEEITPIGEYLARNGIALHDSWRTGPRVVDRTDAFVHLAVDGEGDVFWKPSRANHTEAVRLAEVGGSGLCSALTGGLVPRAERMRFEDREGTKQPWTPTTPIIEINPQGYITRDFDPTALSQRQVDQLFGHMLTDFVISNHDNHAQQFGIDGEGNLVGFDKAQAFKFWKGAQTRSPLAGGGQGPEAGEGRPTFHGLDQDEMFSAYANFRGALRRGDVAIDFDSPAVQDTILRIATLDRATVTEHLGAYATEAYGDQADAFIDDVLARAHAILDDIADFRATLP